MKLVPEPLLMPLTAPFRYGEGTLSGFSFRGIFWACVPFHRSELCYFIWWLSLVASVGVSMELFVSLPCDFLGSGHSLEVFPYSLPLLQSYIISLGPLYSTFSDKDKDKEGSSTILSLKKLYFYQQYMHIFYKIKF